MTALGGQSTRNLIFNQDVSADTLVVQDQLRTNTIIGEQISLSSKSSQGPPNAQISLNPDYISMQTSDEASFAMPRSVEKLEASHGLKNVRAIRLPLHSVGQDSGLEIISNKELELSGNLGLGIHSRAIQLESTDLVELFSREGSILIRSGEKLLLPSIGLASNDVGSFMGEPSQQTGTHQLCISRSDGLVYQSTRNTC